MFFRIFSLHPDIFSSFWANSLIARGVEKKIISYEIVNWREKFGIGNYKQVDDKPYGGGSGMVLQVEPIFEALKSYGALSDLFKTPEKETVHQRIEPNNQSFLEMLSNATNLSNKASSERKKATILLTPRGFPVTQKAVSFLSQNFNELNILCGRYEGFDSRVSEFVDMEFSIGNFVTNGGEVPAMALVEAVSRLVPGFVTKNTSILHDSFSSELNFYREQEEFVVGKKALEIKKNRKSEEPDSSFEKKQKINHNNKILNLSDNLFSNQWWKQVVLPQVEHPHYSRPLAWHGYRVPEVLMAGDHKKIQQWRSFSV